MLKRTSHWYDLILAFLYVAIPTYAVFIILGKPVLGTDDSDIYLQYTKNFTSGYGIVYNPGGEHVEGFSSTLYFLICSFFNWLSATPEKLIMAFNFYLAIASCFLMLDSIRMICGKFQVSALNQYLLIGIYLFWMLINPSFFCWTIVTLMDSGIYIFLLILSYWYFLRFIITPGEEKKQMKIISILIFLMIIGRPEGPVWAMVYLFLFFLIMRERKTTWKEALRSCVQPLFVTAITISLLTTYRLWYFGYPLPNTYYTKVSGSFAATIIDGFNYFKEFIRICNFFVLVPAALLLIWLGYNLKREKDVSLKLIVILTLLFILTNLGLPVIEGGDHFHAFRFFQPAYTFLVLPVILLLLIFRQGISFVRIFSWGTLLSLLFLFMSNAGWANFARNNNKYVAPEDYSLDIRMEFYIAEYTRENGRRLNDFFNGDLPVIGFGAAGGIALGYDGVVYDMLGLNLPKLAHADKIKNGPKAHQSFNKKVFYELHPDIFMPTAELNSVRVSLQNINAYYCTEGSWDNLIFKNIFNDEEFKQHYTLVLVSNSEHPSYICYGYFNNDYLKRLYSKPGFKFQIFK